MTSEEAENLAEAIIHKLNNRRSIDEKTHHEDHAWLKAKRVAEEKRADFWYEMQKHVVRWGLIGSLTWVLYAVWWYFKHLINNGAS